MDAEEFCLRWNNHHYVLVNVLDKLLEQESMCDVTLAADHQFIRVHRLVLCACSSYFEQMLSKQIDKQAFIFLKDVKFPDLKALVDYMYKGEVNVAQEQLSSFLHTAEALEIKGLAYKESTEESSRSKSSQNSRQASKRTNEVLSSPSPSAASSSNTTSRQDDGMNQQHNQSQTSRQRPPPTKKSNVASADSPRVSPPVLEPLRLVPSSEPDVHFVSVGPKIESEPEIEQIEDGLGNGTDYSLRDDDDQWSDPGMITPSNNMDQPSTSSAHHTGTNSMNNSRTNDSSTSAQSATRKSSTSRKRGGAKGEESRNGCPTCQRTYKHKKHLYRHLRLGGCGELASDESRVVQNHPFPVYRCVSCHYMTYIRGFLDRHHRIVHGRTDT